MEPIEVGGQPVLRSSASEPRSWTARHGRLLLPLMGHDHVQRADPRRFEDDGQRARLYVKTGSLRWAWSPWPARKPRHSGSPKDDGSPHPKRRFQSSGGEHRMFQLRSSGSASEFRPHPAPAARAETESHPESTSTRSGSSSAGRCQSLLRPSEAVHTTAPAHSPHPSDAPRHRRARAQ